MIKKSNMQKNFQNVGKVVNYCIGPIVFNFIFASLFLKIGHILPIFHILGKYPTFIDKL